ncbi:hypothetical protein ACFSJ0_59410 [Nonomuraea guangzhouensis]|uniref:Uncharacterized protein n=2 Tax=Nonomuraea guangzhouensis TaxID=1291555 RepID=A0ABW4GX19_9ACTN
MADTLRLSPDGPHNDDYTCQVAAASSEAVRVLNHATLFHAGVTHPSTVNDVLGAISRATAGLDQLLRQLGEALRRMQASTQLGDDRGNPVERVDRALSELKAARAAARTLAARLERAFNATAGLHLTDGRED